MSSEADWLATLRPSRIREVQAGAAAWASVHLVDINCGYADPLRSTLEAFGLDVRRTRVGQPRHLVAALSQPPSADFVVLACHGEDGTILLPELDEQLARHQPFGTSVSAETLAGFARFDDAVVIATGCDTGSPALATTVLELGARAYVAPSSGPFGYASLFAPIFLFYELTEQRDLETAVRRLAAHDEELAMWRLHFRPPE